MLEDRPLLLSRGVGWRRRPQSERNVRYHVLSDPGSPLQRGPRGSERTVTCPSLHGQRTAIGVSCAGSVLQATEQQACPARCVTRGGWLCLSESRFRWGQRKRTGLLALPRQIPRARGCKQQLLIILSRLRRLMPETRVPACRGPHDHLCHPAL